MRQVTSNMLEHFKCGEKVKRFGGNTQVCFDEGVRYKYVVLHSTIICYACAGYVSFSNGGWNTPTTAERLSRDNLGMYVTTKDDIYKLPCTISI